MSKKKKAKPEDEPEMVVMSTPGMGDETPTEVTKGKIVLEPKEGLMTDTSAIKALEAENLRLQEELAKITAEREKEEAKPDARAQMINRLGNCYEAHKRKYPQGATERQAIQLYQKVANTTMKTAGRYFILLGNMGSIHGKTFDKKEIDKKVEHGQDVWVSELRYVINPQYPPADQPPTLAGGVSDQQLDDLVKE